MKNNKVLIVENISHEGHGLVGEILDENGLYFDIVDLSQGQDFPNPAKYSAVFVFGGPSSANDKTTRMNNELKQIKQILSDGIPYFGICLGIQTLVKAAGGEVYRNDVKEIGFRDQKNKNFEIELTNEGKKDPIFFGIKSPMKIFHLHGETIKLNSNMKLLATGKYCTNQVVKIGKNAYGFQGHLELTDSMLEEWITQDSDLKTINADSLRSDYSAIKSEYQNNTKTILNNFLEIANFKKLKSKIMIKI